VIGRGSKLPLLAEIGSPASSNGRAWGLRRADLETLRKVLGSVADRRVVLVTGEEAPAATLAVALAGVAAAAGTPTALVECDVERPRLAADLGLAPEPGLHEYLRWEATPAQIVQPLALLGSASSAGAGPLACVCAGRPVRDARTLLGLGSFRHMTTKLRSAYDLVVLLGPGLEGAGGALSSAAAEADCSLAALAERPSRRAAKANHDALVGVGAPPLGAVVVNPAPEPASEASADPPPATEPQPATKE
jgi:Mrp family chromosome partitioning ATPase